MFGVLIQFLGLAEIIVTSLVVWEMGRSLKKRRASAAWWMAFGAACLAGLVLGDVIGVFDYRLPPDIGVLGIPVPISIHVHETSFWPDEPFILGTGEPLLPQIGNQFFFLGLSVLPIWLANRRWLRTYYDKQDRSTEN